MESEMIRRKQIISVIKEYFPASYWEYIVPKEEIELADRITALFSAGERELTKGDMLICENNRPEPSDSSLFALTIGKEYEVIRSTSKGFVVINDNKGMHWFKHSELTDFFRTASLRTAGVKMPDQKELDERAYGYNTYLRKQDGKGVKTANEGEAGYVMGWNAAVQRIMELNQNTQQ